jgi:hypothetical protein
MELTKESAQNILESRKVIGTTGKYEFKVTNVTPYERDLGNGMKQVAIANLAAMTEYHAEKAVEDFNSGLYQDATNHNMSISVREKDYMPAKGEILECSVIEVFSKNTQQDILVVGGYKGQPIKKATKFSFADALADARPRVEIVTEEAPAFGEVKSKAKSKA